MTFKYLKNVTSFIFAIFIHHHTQKSHNDYYVKISICETIHHRTLLHCHFQLQCRRERWLLVINNNNKHFFNLQVANSPSRLRFEANLSRESSECTEHSQDQTSQINTGKTVYVGNAWLKKYVLRLVFTTVYMSMRKLVVLVKSVQNSIK